MDAAAGVSMAFDLKRHSLELQAGIAPAHAVAWGRFDDRIATTGWSELSLETSTSKAVSNEVKMYSAGFVEGMLTCVRMSDFYANTYQLLMRTDSSIHALAAVRELLHRQIVFLKEKAGVEKQVSSEEPQSPYWKHARYVLFQLWGVCDGYNFAARQFEVNTLGLEEMLILNSGAELAQLMEAYSPEAFMQRALAQTSASFLQHDSDLATEHRRQSGPALPRRALGSRLHAHRGARRASPRGDEEDLLDDAHWEQRLSQSGRCSAFVRVADGNQDLFVGHTTWDDYSKMTRIFKYYKFNLEKANTVATHIAFSSYPGVVSSTDDFYLTDSGLVMMETSIEVLDPSVWDAIPDFAVSPRLPSFVHIMITNRMAKSAAEWVRLFKSADTGASASQWMVIDYNQFKANTPVQDNTLWVLEAIPGVMHMKDMSYYLREHGFWPSFNRPFFDEVREVSGHAVAERSHGSLYSWSDNPRAKIFAAAAGGTNALFDMRGLMSRNLYPNTSVVPSEPGHEISARMDLSPQLPVPNGGIDAKVTSSCLVEKLKVQAVSGPSHSMQKPFRWRGVDGTELWPGWPHIGLPDVWNFSFVQFSPVGVESLTDIGDC
uniref:Phospholipase B-like n=1 Tax=Pyrodinium bahamense TaxID=73915 RepID=A0A7S0G106_9DINO